MVRMLSIFLSGVLLSSFVVAAEPLMMADFEKADAVHVSGNQAQAKRVASTAGQALEISTQEVAYPSVLITPISGKWDLSKFDGVAMDVRNLEDAPLRVLLSINNPGADGRKNCNTESLAVGPSGKGTLTVPFGSWHGERNHPLDQSNIVSLMVLLDKPGRTHRFVVDNLRAVTIGRIDMEKIQADPFYAQLKPAFGRGVNLGNALDAPNEGEWGVTLQERYFELIKEAGFDSVRIPVRWSNHAAMSPPYKIDASFLARVDWAVEQALSRKLQVVLNIHHYDGMTSAPDEHQARYLALWDQLASHYQDRPPALAFELLNEPHSKLTADKWNLVLSDALAVVRTTNPSRLVVIGPVQWNGISELKNLELPETDRNLVVTFHYYSPFKFTHQGASWAGKQAQEWLGTRWTGTQAEQADVRRDLDTALAWAIEHKRPIYMGEFGAYERADLESRARWTKFLADEALKRKIGYAYWEFCSGFGAYDQASREWRTPLRDALVPGKN